MVIQRTTAKGFSLIELISVVALLGLFLTMATPSIQGYLENTRVRNVAESIEAGMQKARSHAVNKNTPTEIVIDTRAGTWVINELRMDSTATPPIVTVAQPGVETFTWGAGGHNWASVATTARPQNALNSRGQTTVTFDGIGRLLHSNVTTATNPPNNITVTSSLAGTRRLQVDVLMTGGVRMCDLDLPATDTKSCRFVSN
ncbi:MAG: GspH/FimT family pseudopilin [Burkholderiales bacterium]|jgi:type IV fimbrial biogenesis protein FimT|nr:GspH/FimT family pseudopilin [Burkholderiales bacterium]